MFAEEREGLERTATRSSQLAALVGNCVIRGVGVRETGSEKLVGVGMS